MNKRIGTLRRESILYVAIASVVALTHVLLGRVPSPDLQNYVLYSTSVVALAGSGVLFVYWGVAEARNGALRKNGTLYMAILPAASVANLLYRSTFLSSWRWTCGATAFFAFACLVAAFLIRRYCVVIRTFRMAEWVVLGLLTAGLSWIQVQCIIMPLYKSSTALAGASLALYGGYRLVFSFVVALVLLLSPRVVAIPDVGFLSTVLMIHVSGYGWAYRFASQPMGIADWTWQFWSTSVLVLLIIQVYSFRNNDGLLGPIPETAPWKSVRAMLALALFAGCIVTVCALLWASVIGLTTGPSISLISAVAVCVWFGANVLAYWVSFRLRDVGEKFGSDLLTDAPVHMLQIERFPVEELQKWAKFYDNTVQKLITVTRKLEIYKQDAEVGALAAQVSHDIRSPLAALKTVSSELEVCSGDVRTLVIEATNRIATIAESLLERRRAIVERAGEESQEGALIVDAIKAVITEKNGRCEIARSQSK